MSLFRSFLTVSGFTLLSRVFGFVRDIIFASVMGAGPLADAFFVAFKLPNFFRRLFAEGAFNAAFVPMFSHKLAEEGEQQAMSFANRVFAVLLGTLIVFCILMEIAMPWVLQGLAYGFVDDEEQFSLAVDLTRITFPYLLFISLMSLLAGMQQSVQRFAASASAPILLNICLIMALLTYELYASTPAHGAAIGVCVAGVVQFLWLFIACLRGGQRIVLQRPRLTPDVKEFLKKMIPGAIGAGVMQINLLVDIIIATSFSGAISYLYYADRLNQLPLSIIGIALGTALLPMLSRQFKSGKKEEAINSQNRALEIALFLTLPAMGAFLIIAEPLIAVLFERGAFTAEHTKATSYGLMAYALGLPAFVMVKIFAPVFFAQGDTKTPVRVAIYALLANVVLNIIFVILFQKMGFMPHIGLALATSISSWMNCFMLVRLLIKRNDYKIDTRARSRVLKIIISVVVMMGVLWLALPMLPSTLIGLVILISCGKLSYLFCAFAIKAVSLSELKSLKRN
jgi:putative peptidoglycan lipid II flippase